MGMRESKVEVLGKNIEDVAFDTLVGMIDGSTEFVTIYYGEEIEEKNAEKLSQRIENKFNGDLEVTAVYGGQPIYYYIIAVE